MRGWVSLGLLSAGLLFSTSALSAPARCVQIVGVNDLHGHIEEESVGFGPVKVKRGGLAALGGYVAILKKQHPGEVLLLSAGDLFQGTLLSNSTRGAVVIQAMNALGFQASAIGNHEFDFGPEKGSTDRHGVLKKRIEEARFPFLVSNLYEKRGGNRPSWKNVLPSSLVTVNGLKVGIVGAITQETPTTTQPVNVASLEFRDPAPEVIEESKRLKAQGAQVIVLLAHIGGACSDLTNQNATGSCDAQSELFHLLSKLPPRTVDVAIGGHRHQYIAQHVNGVATSEAGSYGSALGWVQACVASDGKVATELHQPIDLCLQTWNEGGCQPREKPTGITPAKFLDEPVVPSAEVAQVIAPFLSKAAAAGDEPLGVELTAALPKKRDEPSALGSLVAEGVRKATRDAQFGLVNGNSIRGSLPAGPLVFKNLFEVLPFDNKVVNLRVTGLQLRKMLGGLLHSGHGFPQLSGATVSLSGETVVVKLNDGSDLADDKEFIVATNDFVATGGDGTKPVVSTLPASHRIDTGILIRDAVLEYLKSLPQPVNVPAQ